MGQIYDLGPRPRPVLVRFTRDDLSTSADYIVQGQPLEIPDGVIAVEIMQMPFFPRDYPQGDNPGWGNSGSRGAVSGAPSVRPGEGTVTRVEVRGPERFRSHRK